jgi:hypothetical protein
MVGVLGKPYHPPQGYVPLNFSLHMSSDDSVQSISCPLGPSGCLTLLNPVLGFGSPALVKFQLYKLWVLMAIQCSEWAHSDIHVMGGILAILAKMQPSNPCLLLFGHIVTQVCLNPLVDDISFPICLGMITCTGCQLCPYQSEQILLESIEEPTIHVARNNSR